MKPVVGTFTIVYSQKSKQKKSGIYWTNMFKPTLWIFGGLVITCWLIPWNCILVLSFATISDLRFLLWIQAYWFQRSRREAFLFKGIGMSKCDSAWILKPWCHIAGITLGRAMLDTTGGSSRERFMAHSAKKDPGCSGGTPSLTIRSWSVWSWGKMLGRGWSAPLHSNRCWQKDYNGRCVMQHASVTVMTMRLINKYQLGSCFLRGAAPQGSSQHCPGCLHPVQSLCLHGQHPAFSPRGGSDPPSRSERTGLSMINSPVWGKAIKVTKKEKNK